MGMAHAQYFGEGPVTLNTPAGASDIQWFRNGSPIAGGTSTSFTASSLGIYHAEYTDGSTSCANDSTVHFVLKNEGDTVSLIGISGADSYQWRDQNGNMAGATAKDLSVSQGGLYSLVANHLGCSITTNEYYVFDLCTPPIVNLSAPTCNNGMGTYTVSFSSDPGVTIGISGGSDNGNGTATANLGTSMQITATSVGGCSTQQTVHPPVSCPLDLGIVFKVTDGIVNGVEEQLFLVRVRELLGNDSDGSSIVVRLDKLPDLQIQYQPNLSQITIAGQQVSIENTTWIYDGTHPDFHVFRFNQIISGGTTTNFGFKAVFDPGASRGKIPLTARVTYGGPGEQDLENNIDTETLAFFPD
jgi:hypothetical protein